MIALPAHRSERTCLGCRTRDALSALVRLAAEGDHVVVDARRRRPGRGAWVHPTARCASRLAVGALERGFRRKLAPGALSGVVAAVIEPARGARQAGRERVELPSASAGGTNGRPAEPK